MVWTYSKYSKLETPLHFRKILALSGLSKCLNSSVFTSRVFNILKIWIEKFWLDFNKDCPALGEETLAWFRSIMLDPSAGGGPDLSPEKFTGSAKVAASLHDKLSTKLQNPNSALPRKRNVCCS